MRTEELNLSVSDHNLKNLSPEKILKREIRGSTK